MPWLCVCIGAALGLACQVMRGELSSWWWVLAPAPVYIVVQVLLGLAWWFYSASKAERW